MSWTKELRGMQHGGSSRLLQWRCRWLKWAMPPCSHTLTLPCGKQGGHACFYQHNNTFILYLFSQSSLYTMLPKTLAFLLLPCAFPGWAPTGAFSFSWFLSSPSLPWSSSSACSPQQEWRWRNHGFESVLQVAS